MRTTAEYLSILRTFYRSQAAKYGITRMGIFGSAVVLIDISPMLC